MELKHKTFKVYSDQKTTPNQPIVELKLIVNDALILFEISQSDHIGIETGFSFAGKQLAFDSQSDHTGIEILLLNL